MGEVVRITEMFGEPGTWFEDPDGDLAYPNTIEVPRREWDDFRDAERRLKDAHLALRTRRQLKARTPRD